MGLVMIITTIAMGLKPCVFETLKINNKVVILSDSEGSSALEKQAFMHVGEDSSLHSE